MVVGWFFGFDTNTLSRGSTNHHLKILTTQGTLPKAEVLAFVQAQGRGGQTAAAKKFGISALTISNWRKKAGGAKTGRVTTPRKPSTKAAGTWEQMVALKADIDVMERKLAAKKAEFGKLAKRL